MRPGAVRLVAIAAAIAPVISVAAMSGSAATASAAKSPATRAGTSGAAGSSGTAQHSGGLRGVVPPGEHSGRLRGVVPPGQHSAAALRADFVRLRALGLRGPDLVRALAQLAGRGTGSSLRQMTRAATTGMSTRGTITGVIHGVGGAALRGACVTATGPAGAAFAMTGPDGRYVLANLRPGRYVLAYRDCAAPGRYFRQWSGGAAWSSLAGRVSVAAGQVRVAGPVTLRPVNPAVGFGLSAAGLSAAGSSTRFFTEGPSHPGLSGAGQAAVRNGGRITGLVTGNGHRLKGICVAAFPRFSGQVYATVTSKTGRYALRSVRPGRYVVQFAGVFCSTSGNWLQHWYKGGTSLFPPAHPFFVRVRAGKTTSGIDAKLTLGGEISGTVTSKSGLALRGICVTVFGRVPGGFVGFGLRTGQAGKYALHAVFPSRYIVGFSIGCGNRGNYAPQWWRNSADPEHATKIHIVGPRIAAHVNAVLQPGGTITGAVQAADTKQPLSGVCVEATNRDGSVDVSAQTSSTGSYRLIGLSTGRYQVFFDPTCGGETTSNYLTATLTATVTAGATTSGVDASLQPGGAVSGTVTDSPRHPVSGICVQIEGPQGAFNGTQTASDGTYSIGGMPPGSYIVQFSGGCGNTGSYAPQFYNNESNLFDAGTVKLTSGNVTTGIDATMQPGGTISGVVTNSAGHRLGGICVAVIGESLAAAGEGFFIGFTSSGHYRVPNLGPGPYLVDFGCGGGKYVDQWFRSAASPFTADLVSVNAGKVTSGISAALKLGGAITGVVTNRAGRGLTNMCVVAVRLPLSATSIGLGAITQRGHYRIVGLAAGRYDVQFADCSNHPVYGSQWYKGKATLAAATPVRVTGGGTTRRIGAVMKVGGSISGTVRNASTHAGLRDMCLFAVDPATLSFGFAVTDVTGRYAMTGLATGRYLLIAGPCGNQNLVTIIRPGTVRVIAPHATTGVKISLPVGGSVSGTVLSGSPTAKPAGVCVDVVPINPAGSFGFAITAANGSYTVTGLATGSYQVLFGDPFCFFGNTAFAPQWWNDQPSQKTATPVSVTGGMTTSGIGATMLPGGLGAVAGTVTGPTSAPVRGECVTAFPIKADLSPLFNGGPPEIAVTLADGSYSLGDLLPGTYKVRFDVGCGAKGLRTQWWHNATSASKATLVKVSPNATTTGINAALTY